VLIDACAYYRRLEQALHKARRSILIVGWDFDGRIRLRPDADDSKPLGDLLRSLVETHPELEIRILVWSVAVLHAPGAPLPLLIGAEWQNHPRIHLKLDTQHPIYGAHHQKLVSIDDTLAFAGGMDLTIERWDTDRHCENDPGRVNPDGTPYSPVHDIQMVVDGDAARALAELARERWRVATGETLGPAGACEGCWPEDLEPDFRNTPVAIARTAPAWGNAPAVRECAALTADALMAARRSIFIEAQYLTAPSIGDILAERIGALTGPEVVVLLTRSSHGAVEQFVMGTNRDRLIRKIRRADRFDRLRIYYPVTCGAGGDCDVLIHSKLIIVDDMFLRIGSSNLNNRSIGLDTECDLAIEAGDDETRATIKRLRERLLAEHLDATPAEVADAVAAEGSLIRAIERLNVKPRGLRRFKGIGANGPTGPVIGTRFLDPKRPFEPLWFLRRRPRERRSAGGRRDLG
jgi:phosphatidylserine/phosphatidylglycerophosphate/cardiolipin synthase-like enzyme